MSDTTEIIIDGLRRYIRVIDAREQETTAKLVKVLQHPESTFISHFNGEEFLELSAMRQQIRYVKKALATLDEGEIDPQVWLDDFKANYLTWILNNAGGMASSTSTAQVRMNEYERNWYVKIYEKLNW